MSINRPRGAEVQPNSLFRKAIKLLFAGSLCVSCSDTPPYEPPERMPAYDDRYDYLFEGIEIVPDGTLDNESPLEKPIIPDDPDCSPETCKPA